MEKSIMKEAFPEKKKVRMVLELRVSAKQYEAILRNKDGFLKTMTMEMEPELASLYHLELE